MALEITVGPPLLTISQGHTVLASEPDGQIYPDTDKGLYFFDTRMISTYRIFANGRSFDLLNAGAVFYFASRSFLISPEFETEDGMVVARSLGLTLSRVMGDGLHEDFELTNYGLKPVRFNFEILIRCDFADLFDVKANHLVRRGRIANTWDAEATTFTSAYTNAEFRRALRIRNSDSPGHVVNGRLTFEVEIKPGRT